MPNFSEHRVDYVMYYTDVGLHVE